jgi:hypothetical protein
VPNVEVRPTIAGIRAGRDEVLGEAVRQILGHNIACSVHTYVNTVLGSNRSFAISSTILTIICLAVFSDSDHLSLETMENMIAERLRQSQRREKS